MNADVNSATISYDQSKELAQHSDPKVRAALARKGKNPQTGETINIPASINAKFDSDNKLDAAIK